MKKLRTVMLVVVLVLGISWAVEEGSATGDLVRQHSFESAALAIPSDARPYDLSLQQHVARVRTRQVEVSGTADASLTCNHCIGKAASVQVVYAERATSVVARNIATAWASDCIGCRGWAVSIQVVIAKSATAIRAGNRALAVNAACVGCSMSALAVQFVAVGASRPQLSGATLERIRALRDRLLSQLQTRTLPLRPDGTTSRLPSRGTARTMLTSTTAQMANVLTADLGADVTHDVKASQS
jgi:hypothetical protein